MDVAGGGLSLILLLLIPIGLIAIIPATIAYNKGRSFFTWWVYGFLIWIVALIHSLMLTPNEEALEREQLARGNVECPHCAEWIRPAARICRHCKGKIDISEA